MTAPRDTTGREGLVPVRAPSVCTCLVDDEAVLLDEAAQQLHRLNASATLLWACLDGVSSVGDIVADLSEAYSRARADVLADTLALLEQLREQGLLCGETVGGP